MSKPRILAPFLIAGAAGSAGTRTAKEPLEARLLTSFLNLTSVPYRRGAACRPRLALLPRLNFLRISRYRTTLRRMCFGIHRTWATQRRLARSEKLCLKRWHASQLVRARPAHSSARGPRCGEAGAARSALGIQVKWSNALLSLPLTLLRHCTTHSPALSLPCSCDPTATSALSQSEVCRQFHMQQSLGASVCLLSLREF